jgi:hypothetical protein
MPQTVAKLVEAARVVSHAQDMIFVKVRNIRNLRTQPPLGTGPGAARRLDLPKIPCESELPLVIEILIGQYENRIAIDRVRYFAYRDRSNRAASINA